MLPLPAVAREILVPMTSSLYVPGRIGSNCDQVMLDIGTGYFVQTTARGAADFFERKIQFLIKSTDQLQSLVTEKRQQLETVVMVMNSKIEYAKRAAAAKQQ
jgi:prefoldin alpha subunit